MATELGNQLSLVSRNPANKNVIGETARTELEQIPKIVEAARSASISWRRESLEHRLELIQRFRNYLSLNRDALGKLITEEAGKPFTEAIVSEIFAVLETCQWLDEKAPYLLDDKNVELNGVFFQGKRSYNCFQPLGVIGIVSPWNYPFSIPATSILLAIVAGNGAVVKPSPKTPMIAQRLVNIFEELGFPEGLVGLVQGDREECEKLILSGVNRVVFTGSVGGGKAIMKIASEHLVPVTLELGGKHPAIVLPDVDADKCASGVTWSAFTNGGQACASIDRLILVEPADGKVLNKIVERASKLRLGEGMSTDIDVGPLIDEEQLQRVKDLVEDAKSKGAKILCGGSAREDLGGYFFEPTVLTDLKPEMRVLKEEIFGPLLPVLVVDSVEEALQVANNSELGLASSVWTADLELGEELARRIDAGIVWLNDGLFSHVCPDAPWGGIKYSGFGKAHSEYELLDMVCIKNIGVSSQGMRDWHYPYSSAGRDYVEAGMDLLHRPSIRDRLAAAFRALSSKTKMRK